MNFTGGGISWTLGPPGASVNIGKRGTFFNAGIPGTGLYSRERLGAPTPSGIKSTTSHTNIAIKVGVSDDGTVFFLDANDNPLPDKLINAAKKQQATAIRSLIENKCNEINGQINALGEIHFYTPDPNIKPNYQRMEYQEQRPIMPIPVKMGLIDKLFRRGKIEKESAEKEQQYKEALSVWEKGKQQFEITDQVRKHKIETGIYTDIQVMENFIEENLQSIVWPRETNVSTEVLDEGRCVFIDVDLPEIDEIPSKTAHIPQRGFKLSVKEMSTAQVQKLYMRHIHGIGFRIIGETFTALPNVQEVVLSAFSQRHDRAKGNVEDEYLYSVHVSREKWSKIDFNNLIHIDVVEALSQFDLRRQMSKTGSFKSIEPFEPKLNDATK